MGKCLSLERLGKISCFGDRLAALQKVARIAHHLNAEDRVVRHPLFRAEHGDGSGGQKEIVQQGNRRYSQKMA